MFRIQRNLVKIGAVRRVRVDAETGDIIEASIDGVDEKDIIDFPDEPEPVKTIEKTPKVDPQVFIDDAKQKAQIIIDAAKDEEKRILDKAKEEAEINNKKAWDEGYEKGYEEGKHAFDEEITECDESLKRVIKEIYEERELTYSNLENEMVDLAIKIVRKVINPTEETLAGAFEALIRNALRQIAPDDKIMLRVSPADYERYFSEGSAIFELGNGVTVSASILKDLSLEEYDCIIDKDDSTVNAGLDTQLKHVQLAFQRG